MSNIAMKPLVIYGCGAVGRLALQIAFDINRVSPTWDFLGFLDDAPDAISASPTLNVLGGIEWLKQKRDVSIVVAVGDPVKRFEMVARLRAAGQTEFATLVHPTCWISERVSIGIGVIIYMGVMVDPDVEVGEFVNINKGVTLGHDCRLMPFATLSPSVNVGGHVVVGTGTYLGINSCSIQNREIGEWCVIGAGATVVNDIPAGTTAVGSPARPIKWTDPTAPAAMKYPHAQLVIIGAGGAGSEALWVARRMFLSTNGVPWLILGYIDDNPALVGKSVNGLPVLGGAEEFVAAHDPCHFHCAIGTNATRRRLVGIFEDRGFKPATLIDPTATMATSAIVGDGSYVGPRACISPLARLGRHTLININACVAHDSQVGDFATVSPGVKIGGNVEIGIGAYLGIGSCTIQNVKIGDWCMVGAGATVVDDVPAGTTVVGTPARPIKKSGPNTGGDGLMHQRAIPI